MVEEISHLGPKIPALPMQEKVYMDDQHGNDVMRNLSQLWRDEKMCDAEIQNGTITMKAHKIVLTAACPALLSIYKDIPPQSSIMVNLPSDIDRDTIQAFLVYIYDGMLRLTVDTLPQMTRLAKVMKERTVLRYCEDFQVSCVAMPLKNEVPWDFHPEEASDVSRPVLVDDIADDPTTTLPQDDTNIICSLQNYSIHTPSQQVHSSCLQIGITDEENLISTQTMMTSTQPVITPMQTVTATIQTLTAPMQTVTKPMQTLFAPMQTLSSPMPNLTAPMQTLSAPSNTFNGHGQSLVAPAQILLRPPQKSPTKRFAIPLQTVTGSTDRLRVKVPALSAPIKPLAGPTELVATPRNPTAGPQRLVLRAVDSIPPAIRSHLKSPVILIPGNMPLPTKHIASIHPQVSKTRSIRMEPLESETPTINTKTLGETTDMTETEERLPNAPTYRDFVKAQAELGIIREFKSVQDTYFSTRNCLQNDYKCKRCSISLFSEPHTFHHLETEHQILIDKNNKDHEVEDHVVATPKSDPSVIQCGICDHFQRRTSKENINHHRYFKHRIPMPAWCKLWICDVCGKEYAKTFFFKEHLNTHKQQATYVCQVCGMGFASQNSLTSHIYNCHNDEKRFRCKLCGKDFKHAPQLRIHTRSHTGMRPYQCPECPYKCTVKGNLKMHMLRLHKKSIEEADIPTIEEVKCMTNFAGPIEDMMEVLPSSENATCK